MHLGKVGDPQLSLDHLLPLLFKILRAGGQGLDAAGRTDNGDSVLL